jgi:hypothetical protein
LGAEAAGVEGAGAGEGELQPARLSNLAELTGECSYLGVTNWQDTPDLQVPTPTSC